MKNNIECTLQLASPEKHPKKLEDVSRNSFGLSQLPQISQLSESLGDSLPNQFTQRNKTIQFHLANLPTGKITDLESEEATYRYQREGALKSKFKKFMFKLKLQSWIKKIANHTRSRMFRNLSFKQLEMIGDYSYDSVELGYVRPKQSQFALTSNDSGVFLTKSSVLQRALLKIDKVIPVLSQQNILIAFIDFAGLLSVLFLLFTLSIAVSFHVPINNIVNVIFPIICCSILILGIFVKLNTAFNKFGSTVTSRYEIWLDYYQKRIISDSFSLLAVIALMIIDYHSLGLEDFSPDLYSCVKFILFIPFFLRLKLIFSRIQNLEDKIAFKQRTQHAVQLGRLLAIIILIDHVMACIWIFNSKFSSNKQKNWLVQMKAVDYPWYYQYAMAFYYSTVTMTTVGYGDIISQNMSEFILTTVLVMTSSGVFGFTLSQIGTIFSEFQAENKELKKKLNIINLYMEKKNVNHSLRSQVREYLEYTQKENNEKFVNESAAVVEELNEDLKKQLYLHQNKKIINYLENFFSEALIQNAILIIEEQQVKPQQIIQTQGSTEDICLYLIEKGKVEIYLDCINPVSKSSNAKSLLVLDEGQIFGKSEFFNGECKNVSVKALGFVNLLKIKRTQFMKILSELPTDLETFHYLKDKLVFSKDFKKINDCCLSCNSSDHTLSNCRYLHLTTDKQSLFAKLNYKNYSQQLERRKEWKINSVISDKSPQETNYPCDEAIKTRGNDRKGCFFIHQEDQEYEEFLLSNYNELDEYEEEYLKYDFSYSYINGFSSEDEEDYQNDEKHRFHKSESEGNKHLKEQLADINGSKSRNGNNHIPNIGQPKSKVHENVFQMLDSIDVLNHRRDLHGEKKLSWKEYESRYKGDGNKRSPIDSPGVKQNHKLHRELLDGMNRKNNRRFTENHMINSNPVTSRISVDFYDNLSKPKNTQPNHSNFLQQHTAGYDNHDEKLKSDQEQLFPEIINEEISISGSICSSLNSQSSPAIQSLNQIALNGISNTNLNPIHSNSSDTAEVISPINPGNPAAFKSNLSPLNTKNPNTLVTTTRHASRRLSTKKVTFNSLVRPIRYSNDREQDQYSQHLQYIQQQQNSVNSPQTKRASISVELQMQELRNQLVNEFQEMMARSQKKDTQLIASNERFENDAYSKFLIFSQFEKQKNYSQFFPHNNLSAILLNYTARNKYISQQQYLQLIQQTGQSRNDNLTPRDLQYSRNKLNEKSSSVQKILSLRHIAFHNTNGFQTDINNSNLNNVSTLNNNTMINTYSNLFAPHSQQVISSKIFKSQQPQSQQRSFRQIILTDDSTAREQSEKLIPSFRSPTKLASSQFIYKVDSVPNNIKAEERSFDAEMDIVSLQSPNVKDEPLEINFSPFRNTVKQPTVGMNNAAYFLSE